LEVSNAVRVLVVEDEAPICSFIEDALSDGGFEACSVHSGEAALSTFRDGRERCRALLTDVNLGDGISRWELARQIRKITPGFPVIYMTGASGPDWKSQGVWKAPKGRRVNRLRIGRRGPNEWSCRSAVRDCKLG
jgi:DNA-binding response OmpR family regulator